MNRSSTVMLLHWTITLDNNLSASCHGHCLTKTGSTALAQRVNPQWDVLLGVAARLVRGVLMG
ncbi:hypothetical protein P3T76_014184 [Phytophthora citrophthora]|uniref:Uncharacterized protein n=1 Tax=Phytophthora citrophthora TaxID=4793 RepID=A0AAD9G1B0_9STRA|nr:hypothetical protein P3T76_014184 [Phytophthora citrophthora]